MRFSMPTFMPGPLEEQKFREQMGWDQAQQQAAQEQAAQAAQGQFKNPFQATMPSVGLQPQNAGQGFAAPPPKPGEDSVFAQLLDPRRGQLAQMTKGRFGGMG